MADYKISISIGAKTDDLKQKTDEATGILDHFKSEINSRFDAKAFLSIGGAMGAGFAAGEAAISAVMNTISGVVTGTIDQITNAFEALDNAGDVADKLAVSSSELLALHGAAEAAGTSGEALDTVLMKLRTNLAQGKGANAIKQLGLDLDTLRNQDPAKSFVQISSALATVGNDTERAGLGVEILGKSAGEVFAMFNEDLSETIERYKALNGQLSDTDITKVGNADQAVKDLGMAWAGVGKLLANELAPAIAVAAKDLTKLIVTSQEGIRSVGQTLSAIPASLQIVKGGLLSLIGGEKYFWRGVGDAFITTAKQAAEAAQAEKEAGEGGKYQGLLDDLDNVGAKADTVANQIRDMQREIEQQGMNKRDIAALNFLEDSGATGAQIAEIQALNQKLKLLDQEEETKKRIADQQKKAAAEFVKAEQEAANIKEAIKSKEEQLAEKLARVEQLRQDDLLTEMEALREKERLLAQHTGDPQQSNAPTQQAGLAAKFSSEANKIIFENSIPKDPTKEAQLRVNEHQLEELGRIRIAIEQQLRVRNNEDHLAGVL